MKAPPPLTGPRVPPKSGMAKQTGGPFVMTVGEERMAGQISPTRSHRAFELVVGPAARPDDELPEAAGGQMAGLPVLRDGPEQKRGLIGGY